MTQSWDVFAVEQWALVLRIQMVVLDICDVGIFMCMHVCSASGKVLAFF